MAEWTPVHGAARFQRQYAGRREASAEYTPSGCESPATRFTPDLPNLLRSRSLSAGGGIRTRTCYHGRF